MKKLNPYTENGIYIAIYNYLIKEWKGVSQITSKTGNENFSNFLKDIVSESFKESSYYFEDSLIPYLDKKIKQRRSEKSEFNTISKETKALIELNVLLKSIRQNKSEENYLSMKKEIEEKILDKYKNLESIHPKKLPEINSYNLVDKLELIKMNKNERMTSFKGLPYKRKNDLHFVDEVSAEMIFYKNGNNENKPINNLISGIVSYVSKVNEIRNTKILMNKLLEIEKDKLSLDSPNFHFYNFSKDYYLSSSSNHLINSNHNKDINNFLSKKRSNN